MDYEKKYKEALEKAKRFCALPTDKATMEDIFPELRKEEKPLTPFQQCLNCILRGVYYAEVPDEKVNEFIVNVIRTRTDELVELAKRHEYVINCQLHESEDERIRKALIDALKVSETIGELKFRLPYPTREECITYLEKQKEEKPDMNKYCLRSEKWREVEETAKNEFSKGYEQGLKEGTKSVEWSEEDERYINGLIGLIEDMKEGISPKLQGVAANSCIAFLKSIRPRPSWKPSEEQMDALKELIDDANRDGWVTPGATELYEQLKKL